MTYFKQYFKVLSVLVSAALVLTACPSNPSDNPNSDPNSNSDNTTYNGKKSGVDEVVVHELSDPDMLHCINSTGASSTYIKYNIFSYLLDIDKENLVLTPSLAKDRAVVTEITEGKYAGGMSLEFEIREEAVWDNGDPITAYDVLFTYKATLCPVVDAEHRRSYIDFIDEMIIDETNDKKFTIWSDEKYYYAEYGCGNTFIMPEHIGDPNKILRGYEIADLKDATKSSELRANAELIEFAQEFNGERFQRESDYVIGSGPYRLEEWITGQRIILKRKDNWWGDQLAGTEVGFDARPNKLVYEIINDWTTAVTALKDEGLDMARGVRPRDYIDLKENDKVKDVFRMEAPTNLAYTYIGLNMNNEKLSDVKVRQALAHCVDVDRIITTLIYGLANPTVGTVHPSKPYYNDDIEPYTYDIEKANALLDEAGWIDANNDGVREKTIDGKSVPLALEFKFNSGNDTRERIGSFLQEEAQRAGIEIDVVAREWTVFLDETKNHDFEIYCGGWVSDPISDDLTQLWHTRSYDGGSNYVGFGDSKTDEMIESLRTELDDTQRDGMYKEMQSIMHEQVPYIFLYTPKNLVAISKRFTNVAVYTARPGYTEREFGTSAAQ